MDRWGVGRAASVVLVVALVLAAVAAHASRGNDATRAVDADAIALTARVNVSTAGLQAHGSSSGAVLSASGRYVAFVSGAATLVPDDRNGVRDVFVRDLRRSTTSRVSVSSSGAESNGTSEKPSISADGRVVVFPSTATNLVAADRNGFQDVFLRDGAAATTKRVSLGPDGEANGPSLASLVSADGHVVAYSSEASNLVAGDGTAIDVFLTDAVGRRTRRVSIGAIGEPDDRSEASSIDARGRVVVVPFVRAEPRLR